MQNNILQGMKFIHLRVPHLRVTNRKYNFKIKFNQIVKTNLFKSKSFYKSALKLEKRKIEKGKDIHSQKKNKRQYPLHFFNKCVGQ